MNNFGRLYLYELKKILHKKMVWITFGVIFCFVLLMATADCFLMSYSIYSADGKEEKVSGYEKMLEERENARILSGRKIDDALLDEMKQANQGKEVLEEQGREIEDGALTTRAETIFTSYDGSFDKEESQKYKVIYDYVRYLAGSEEAVLHTDEKELYQIRKDEITALYEAQQLKEEEIAYWEEREAGLEIPFTYEYAEGGERCLDFLYSMNFCIMMLIAICLSGVFSDEHMRKTDQIISGTRYGKKILYFAKLAAGASFGIGSTGLLLLTGIFLILSIYGADGLRGAIQIVIPFCTWHLTLGETVLWCLALLLLIAGIYSVVIMFLSERLKSSTAAMALFTGVFIIDFFLNIPYRYRMLSQIQSLMPSKIMRSGGWSDLRLVKIFGEYLMSYQFAPLLYLVAAVLFILIGKRTYERFQVTGR